MTSVACPSSPAAEQLAAISAGGYHRWTDLLFVHWRVDPAELAGLVPPGLAIDTWQGDAWVGLVLFHMSKVRPWWSPALPWLSAFHETNVRTYVRCPGSEPGVWFCSLEAASRLAVRVARARWGLNYHRARMQLTRRPHYVRYASRRIKGAGPMPSVWVEASLGDWLGEGDTQRELPPALAIDGSLEHFLLERYVLYTCGRGGRLLKARVAHPPYRVRAARLLALKESLLKSNGVHPEGPPCHAVFCDGFDVKVSRLVGVHQRIW